MFSELRLCRLCQPLIIFAKRLEPLYMGFITTEWLCCFYFILFFFGGGGGSGHLMLFFTTDVTVKWIALNAKAHTISWPAHRTSGDLVVRAARLRVVTNQEMPRGSKACWYFWYILRPCSLLLGLLWFIFSERWVKDTFLVFTFVRWWVVCLLMGALVWLCVCVCACWCPWKERGGQGDKAGEVREGKERVGKNPTGRLWRRLSRLLHSFTYGPGFCFWYCSRFWEYYSHLEGQSPCSHRLYHWGRDTDDFRKYFM